MKVQVFILLLELLINRVKIVILKRSWGSVMYLDTSNVQSLEGKAAVMRG